MPNDAASTEHTTGTAPPLQLGCAWCGYVLTGLPDHGVCPECGRPYTATSRVSIEPWPHPLRIAGRVLWPTAVALIVGIAVVVVSLRWSHFVTIVLAVTYVVVQLAVAQHVITRLVERHVPARIRERPALLITGNLASALCSIVQMLLIGVVAGSFLGWLGAHLLGAIP